MTPACAWCIEASSPTVTQGFMWGMVIMMSMPYLLLVVVGGGLIYAHRQSVRQAVERLLAEERSRRPRPRFRPDDQN